MDRDMRRSAIVSGGLHLALLLAVIIVIPPASIPAATDDDDSIQFIGPHAPPQSRVKSSTPGVNSTKMTTGHQTETPPKLRPIVAPPPPPPPPPPTPDQSPSLPTPPAPPPPPPPPTQTPSIAQAPPPPPTPPQKRTSTAPQPKIPLPPMPQPPAPMQSPTHQQHVVKTPTLSQSVLNTLLNLRSNQPQDKAPTSTYNPDQQAAPNAGGDPDSTANSELSGADKNAIGNHVRPCWGIDAGAPGVATFSVYLDVTTDEQGVVREAEVDQKSQGQMGDPIYNAYAQRAMDAVMNVQCATLPLPAAMLGQQQKFVFQFSP